MGTPTNLRWRFKTASPPRIFVVPQPYSSWYYRLVLIIGAFFPADAYARAGLLEYQACVSLDAQINVRVFGCSEIIADIQLPLIPAEDGKNNSDLLKKLIIEKMVRLGGASK